MNEHTLGSLTLPGPVPPANVYWLAGPLVLTAFLSAYWSVFRTLLDQWSTNDTYSFGVLVPFISAYLIWTNRERLRAARIEPALTTGATVVLGAALLLLAGRLSAIVALQELSLILMLAGLTLLLFGPHLLRVVWFPLIYLLLMLPVWEIVTDRLHYQSQLISAWLAEALLRSVGVPVIRDQIYLELPNIRLEVASACSGVNFLIAVVATGIPQAYLFLRGWIPRTAVIAFAVVIAFLSNGLRVGIIGVLAYHEWSEGVHGPGHLLQGLFVSAIGFVAVLAGIQILAIWYPRLPDRDAHIETVASGRVASPPRRFAIAALCGTAMLVIVPSLGSTLSALEVKPVVTAAFRLPETWRPAGAVAARFVNGIAGEASLAQVFRTAADERVELYIGTLAQSAGDSMAYRSIALPRQIDASQVTLARGAAREIRVNRAVWDDGESRTTMIYWYDLGGRTTAQSAVAKAYGSAQLLLFRRLPPARLVAVVEDGDYRSSPDQQTLTRFALDVLSSMQPTAASYLVDR